ncbi:hypothetical protein B23_3636 [Geobacillus thermoleovorans B23]|nr:hypothetical protein B23_3636 [Geobacillus thermoleovorans B23]
MQPFLAILRQHGTTDTDPLLLDPQKIAPSPPIRWKRGDVFL